MARINIEDCWWIDPRRSKLIKLMGGDEGSADGAAVRMWRVAQEFWGRGRKKIPLEIFETIEAAPKLIEAKLAIVEADNVYIRGSSQYLDWINEKREAGKAGGKKSAESRRRKNGTAQPNAEAKPKQARSKVKHAEPSSSSSSSSSSSDSGSNSDSDSVVPVSPAEPSDPPEGLNGLIWAAYREGYFTRYKTDPVRNAKVNAQVSQLAKRLGIEAPDVVRFYLTHDKTFYVNKLHDIGLCVSDAEALRTQWFHGRAVTQTDIKRFERSTAARDLNRLIDEGEI